METGTLDVKTTSLPAFASRRRAAGTAGDPHHRHPPLLWYVLDESVLRHVVGGPAVMRDQPDRLLQAVDAPGILVQVLPFAADNHAGADGPTLRVRLRVLT